MKDPGRAKFLHRPSNRARIGNVEGDEIVERTFARWELEVGSDDYCSAAISQFRAQVTGQKSVRPGDQCYAHRAGRRKRLGSAVKSALAC
jgi:hypothetical protein